MLKNHHSSNFQTRRRVDSHCSSVVIADFGSWELTLREAIFSLLILGVMVAIGFFIAGKIEQTVHVEQLKYRRAMQIDKDPSQFSLALETDVGDVFAEGHLKTVDPVSHELVAGKWMKVCTDYQKYQMHTRTVTYTTTDSKGRVSVKSRVETYWSWDTYDRKETSASQVEFLGEKLQLADLVFYGARWDEEVVNTGYHRRVVISMLPTEHSGTMFTTIRDKKISKETPFWIEQNLASAYEHCTSSFSVLVFWIVWSIVSICTVIGFFVIDNDWLED